jgi:voltage-gated potassium channel
VALRLSDLRLKNWTKRGIGRKVEPWSGMRWEQQESGRVVHSLEWVVLAAALALIPVVVIDSDVKSGGWRAAATAANWVIWAVFAAEFLFVLAVASRRGAAMRAHWLDFALVAVTVPAFGTFLSYLRLFRLVRLLRLLRLSLVLGRALQAERALTSRQVLRLVGLITILVVVIAGAVEATVDHGDFHSVWDGIWWAVVTVTTVGYGDIYPKSVEGRIVGMVVMFAGIGFLSVLTATVASHFVKTDSTPDNTELMDALGRIEADLADLKKQFGDRSAPA